MGNADTDVLNLRAWRKAKGITLEVIAFATKLSVRQLQAIEAGEFRRLPGGIYTTSYLRQYARAIEFDELELLSFYQEFCRETAKENYPNSRRSLAGPLLQN